MKPGTQIAYIPSHAGWNINHPDVEFGFVMSQASLTDYFCRYWTKSCKSIRGRNRYDPKNWTLRTVANSERTPASRLALLNGIHRAPQFVVNQIVEHLEAEAILEKLEVHDAADNS